MKPLKYFALSMSLMALISSCSSAPVQAVGDGQIRKFDGLKVKTELPGMLATEADLDSKENNCQKLKKFPELTLKTEDGRKIKGKAECRPGAVFSLFKETIPPGDHRLSVDSEGSLPSPLRGLVLFYPQEPEKKSGPDQAYLGASPLTDGVNQSTLNSASADLTDWWTITLDKYTPVSFFFLHDGKNGHVSLQAYRLNGSSLVAKQSIPLSRAVTIGLEGTYYLKVSGRPYLPQTNYSISMKKMEDKGGGESLAEAAVKTEFPVIETWPLDGRRSAILLQLEKSDQLKEGEMLKVYSGHQFIDICKVVGVGATESECHLNRSLTSRSNLNVKRSLQ